MPNVLGSRATFHQIPFPSLSFSRFCLGCFVSHKLEGVWEAPNSRKNPFLPWARDRSLGHGAPGLFFLEVEPLLPLPHLPYSGWRLPGEGPLCLKRPLLAIGKRTCARMEAS